MAKIDANREKLILLRKLLVESFDLEELRLLCFDLGLEYDELAGKTKSTKMHDLIGHLDRRGNLQSLIDKVSRERPMVDWPVLDSLPGAPDPKDRTPKESHLNVALANLNALPVSQVVARPQLLAKLIQYIREEHSSAILLQGLPGYGKTVLLGELVRELRNEFASIFAVTFSGPFSIEPSFLVESMNEHLSQLGRGLAREILQRQSFQRNLQLLSSEMADLQLLVVLDAVDEMPGELLEPLLQLLGISSQVLVILSARSRIISREQARILTVPPLTGDESAIFIEHLAKLHDIEKDQQELIVALPDKVKESPQALKMVIINLEDFSIELLMDDLEDVEYVPGEIVSNVLSKLDQSTLSCLALVTLFNNVDFVKSVSGLGLELPNLRTIRTLMERSLIYRSGEMYRVPAVVSETFSISARTILDEVATMVCGALEAEISKLLSLPPGKQVDSMIPVVIGIIQPLHQLQYHRWITRHVTDEFLDLVNLRGLWKEYWLIMRLAFDSARECGEDEIHVKLGFRIARKSFQVRDVDTGRQALNDIEQILDPTGDSIDKAELLSHKALFTELDGNDDKAVEELLESLRIRELLEDKSGSIIVEKLLGNIYLKEDRFVEARGHYEAALQQLEGLGSQSKELVEVQTSLAICDLEQGLPEAAEERLSMAAKHCEQIGYTAGLSRIYYYWALVLDFQGRTAEALEYANVALEKDVDTQSYTSIGVNLLISRLGEESQDQEE